MAMFTHPTIGNQLAQAKIAELHRQASHDGLARAARRTRRGRTHQSRRRLTVPRVAITRHVLTVLGTRNA
jgi:hypothetical protein